MAEKRACDSLVLTNGQTPIEWMFFADNLERCRGCSEGCLSLEILIRIQKNVKGGATIEVDKLKKGEE